MIFLAKDHIEIFSFLAKHRKPVMKQIAYGRVRRKMEGGFTEKDFNAQIHFIEPQGKLKNRKERF